MSTQRVSVCQVDELSAGEMRQFSVGDRDILLARSDSKSDDKFWATAAHCSHYGAPLEKGVLHNNRVICPWHNACFGITSGEQLEPPGRDNLASYAVQVEAGTVYVELSETTNEHVPPTMADADATADSRTFVIVGAGAAGCAAAEMLRQTGFQGGIVMMTAESELPYDRTKLSKAALQSDEFDGPSLLRSPQFYKQHSIEIKTNAPVTKTDTKAQQITYGDGRTIDYDTLLIATGGKVRKLPIDGSGLENVFTIRQVEDVQKILAVAKGAKKAVVIGAGFIGMEAASSLKQKGLEITVVAPNKVPFEKVLGESVGKFFQQVHESEGVAFKLESKAKAIKGENSAKLVVLESGEELPADLVIVGIGVQPATDFIEGVDLNDDDKSVPVNQYLQAAPNVYAAGDIAQFPHFVTGKPVRIEHWRLAMQHGRIAACNMNGQTVPFKAVPYFWSGQFDVKLRYVGHSEKYDDVVIQGSLEDQAFLAFYVENGRVMAVAGVGRDRDIAAISELMRLGKMPAASSVKDNTIDWISQLAKLDVVAA